MDTLLIEMLKLGLGSKSSEEEPSRNTLTVEQIKIVDEEGQMKVVYPSRTDIVAEGITVTRA